ncbi:MAG TPA: hypothetical protein VGO04_09600 [Ensifer sp.]|jgi:hypothetical protein|uniref:hypothetical protein n=1 Tax=Ensifer sp. TaxID=1872086 RepID=UPI002E0E6B4A|nr:hypothetical protein [Ensifer sp.]
MTRIDAAAALNALLRSQPEAAIRSGIGANNASAANQQTRQASERAKSEDLAAQQHESQLLRRVRELSAKDPERRRKAFRLFLESVLLKQLGTALEADQDFSRIVDKVELQIESDPDLRESSRVAADILIERAIQKS